MQKSIIEASKPQQSAENILLQKMQERLKIVEGESWFVVRSDVFAIPYLDGYLLYSPLQGLMCLITRAGLASLLLNESLPVSDCLTECMVEADVETINLFDTQPKQQPKLYSENIHKFRPTRLTLSPTSSCQLACTYCYIRGGDNPRKMPWEIAEAAIRLTTENAVIKGLKEFTLEFHGEGEPTANWMLFRDAILFTEKQCVSLGLTPRFSVVTNGILNDEKISFISKHMIRVSLSMDGLKHSMDTQRPLRGGGSTFEKVMQAIRCFKENGIDFAIRSTVTETNINEMRDFVNFVKAETKCQYINFEPVCIVGRGIDNKIDNTNIMAKFVNQFREARNEGIRQNIDIGFSTCRIDGLRSSFCGAYGTNLNFCVSTRGLVSSCYEVLEEADPRAAIFIYGHYDIISRSFTFFEDRLKKLLNLNVTNMARCQDCYVKWNCGGDCLSKAALEGVDQLTDNEPLERCSLSRVVTKDELFRSLFKTGE